MQPPRPRYDLRADARIEPVAPKVEVRRLVLRPSTAHAPLDSVVAIPQGSAGVLVYFPGFNTPLGPWEILKCRHLAAISGLTVVLTEIPGMSRFHDPIPGAVRREMFAGNVGSWAELNLAYVEEAFRRAEVTSTEVMEVLGFSTGCSLAVAALPVLATWGPIEGLNLVEPVAISRRNLATLQVANLADWGRQPKVLATNRGHRSAVDARRRQRREPSVRYGAADLAAIATVLSGDSLLQAAEGVEPSRCAIARGSKSSLCRVADFDRLDALLHQRGIPGPTITVDGLGHQLWHSLPGLVQVARTMLGGRAETAAEPR